MLNRKWLLLFSVVVATVVAAIGVATITAAGADAPGADDFVVGPSAGLTLQSGEQFNFGLKARLSDHSMLMGLSGGGISLCSIHGPSAELDFATEVGNYPLQGMQCGRAFGNDLVLQGCTASLEYHGFVHSDRSTRIYFGTMTADVQFQKTGANTGLIRMAIYTPKAPILLQGTVQSPTPIVMSTCP